MKRICKIELENSRAYYERLTFSLDKGENLLLYGENGSGKTSLYKSLDDFIRSFNRPVDYISNRYKPEGEMGKIVVSIGDYEALTNQVSNVIDYTFSPGADNLHVANTSFLKALALSKGFLNYRDLMKVYLYDEEQPNLFDFFVEHLLRNHVPLAQGLQNSLAKEWKELNQDLTAVYHRQERKHRKGLRRLEEFEVVLRSVLDNLFARVNNYLEQYFKNFGLNIGYELKPMSFSYGSWKGEWKAQHDLCLKISLGNSDIMGYTEGLNEACLSAIAICLYLAALQANPGKELHFMFLDDIFIGIDSANRRPILEILNNEFKDFQIVIATYDRSWYHMAKNYLEKYAPGKWKYTNLFSLPKTEGGQTFLVPIMVEGDSFFDRAKEYLHGSRDIDLPAAANYFRKALEELLSLLPKELYLNDDYTIVPDFKLKKRARAVGKLFSQIGENTTHIFFLESYLYPLIHPLSHYEEEAQIYRTELIEVENAISELMIQIESFPTRCRLLVGWGNKLEIQYKIVDGSYQANYLVLLEDNIWMYKNAAGNALITGGKCRVVFIKEFLNGEPLVPNKNMKEYGDFCYCSLDDALQKIYDYEVNIRHHEVLAHKDYDIVYLCKGKKTEESINVRRNQILTEMK